MFRDLPRYEAYSAAGEWVAEVPYGWGWEPARTIFAERKVTGFTDEQMLSVTIGRGVLPQSELIASTSKKDSSNPDKSKYKLVEPGDVVYNKMRAWQGAAGSSSHRGIVSPAYVVMTPRAALSEYLHHLVRTPMFAKEAGRWSYGITSDQWSLRPEHFKMIRFPLPPPDEQAAIVKYLAHANARIDKAIAAKRRLISLLDELAAVSISAILTDAGEGSELVSVGQSSWLVQTGPFGSQLHADEYIEGGSPVINPSHIGPWGIEADSTISVTESKAETLDRHRLVEGDVILARRGDLGRSAVVRAQQVGCLCGTGCLIVRLKGTLWMPDYFQMVFSSHQNRQQLQLASIGSTMANLNASHVSRMRLRRPTLERQTDAIRAVTDAQSKHSRRRGLVQREISLLQEFRTRLVADVVTGQVDVRAIAATLPEVPEFEASARDVESRTLEGTLSMRSWTTSDMDVYPNQFASVTI